MRWLLFAVAFVVLPAGSAHAQYFGRNKVQYRSFDFQVLKTEHFDIYYYPQERVAVMDAARMVERSYARLSRVLQHEFRERKPVILYASHTDFQQTNALTGELDESTGGVTESLKSRIILPFTGSYADFDHVLTHELVHGFQYDVLFRKGPIAEANPFMARLPLWFMEGMAEYLSIGRIDALTHSWLRDAVLNGYMRDIGEMSERDDYLSYRFGQSLWAYIGEKWGDEVIGILLQKATRIGVERAFSSTLGISLGELSNEWLAQVRKTYLAQVTEHQRAEDIATLLTRHKKVYDPWFLAPSVSPDGKTMVYLSQQGGLSFDLWLGNAETGKPIKRLVESARSAEFESLRYMYSGTSFSPDGRYVAFAAKAGGQDALNIYDLKRGKIIKKLKFKLNGITSPTWAPDNQRIAFSGLDGGISDLFVTDLNGKLTRLTNDKYADLLPAWSPDGKTIAVTTDRAPDTDLGILKYGELRVALYDVASGAITQLPHQESGKNVNAVWSPDGRKLIWVNDRTTVNNLYLYDLDTGAFSQITDLTSGVIAIAPVSPVLSWASKSGKLVFGYFEQAGYNLYSVADPLALPRSPVAAPLVALATRSDSASPAQPGAAGNAGVPPAGAGGTSPAAGAQGPITSFYRGSDLDFRASADRPVAANDLAPVSVSALLENSSMALPDTSGFSDRNYKVKFTADMIGRPSIGANVGDYYGNGLYGGSYIALSDMLGDHSIVLAGNVNGSFSDASFLGAYTYMKKRANFLAAFQQIPLYRYYGGGYFNLNVKGEDRTVAADVYVRDVIRAGTTGISYPFSPFSRAELNMTGVLYKSEVLYRGYDAYTGDPIQKDQRLDGLKYLQPEAALVFDNTYFGWTGPVVGRRWRAQVSHTYGDINFAEALLDLRNYWNYKQKLVLAGRLVGLSRFGDQSDRFALYWGGPYYLRGYDYNSFDPGTRECTNSRYYGPGESLSQCPVRDQLVGSSAALLNTELRFPIISELQIGFLGNFPPVDAVAFFDGGMAWDAQVCTQSSVTNPNSCAAGEKIHVVWDRKPGQDPFLYREPLFSYGIGLRMNIFYTVLRFDYAWPVNRMDRGGVFSISFGPSF